MQVEIHINVSVIRLIKHPKRPQILQRVIIQSFTHRQLAVGLTIFRCKHITGLRCLHVFVSLFLNTNRSDDKI